MTLVEKKQKLIINGIDENLLNCINIHVCKFKYRRRFFKRLFDTERAFC
jgi:hypothetical protein